MNPSCHRYRCLAVLAGIALLQPWPAVAADPDVDRFLAAQCAQCHGTEGKAKGDIDDIAGEEAQTLFDKLVEMKRELDEDDMMHYQARGYTDDQLWRISLFYAALPEDEKESRHER